VVYLYLDRLGAWFSKRKPQAVEESEPAAAADTRLNHESA
jgi:HAE1 family hydrophobic/amphiphilic exporter-1